MSKRFKLVTISMVSVVLVGILAVSFSGTALADGPQGVDDEESYCVAGLGGWHGHEAICSETVSALLGLTTEEIQAQRQEGKSLVEIAAAQGVSEDTLVEAILAAMQEAIQEKVEAGILAEEQADLMFQQMEQRIIEALNRTTIGPPDDHGFCGYGQPGQGMSPGAMRHWGRQGGHGPCYGDSKLGTGPGLMQRWGRGTL